MNQQLNTEPRDQSKELKSFHLYLGKKAPILIQIIAGVLWLGAAGLLLTGVGALFFDPIFGITLLFVGVFAIITGKSLFGMKKSAIRNSIIFAILLIALVLWKWISVGFTGGLTENTGEIFEILFAILLVLVVFRYKERFVN